ncbi:MAG: hypothetical protein SWH78_13225 [Thermodesulfobacteriota bacterium]|nr:hypothetical protein [Thermodesulfobacteriota bacterium]
MKMSVTGDPDAAKSQVGQVAYREERLGEKTLSLGDIGQANT